MRSAPVFVSALALGAMLSGCAHLGPALGAVMSRVDVPTVIECFRQPTAKAKAICLGVEVLTPGVEVALEKAARKAEEARDAAGPAGADDMTDAQRRALAAELDAALDELGAEIDAANRAR